eukprot:1147187-Pelagomonas_calceolata.AAC.1
MGTLHLHTFQRFDTCACHSWCSLLRAVLRLRSMKGRGLCLWRKVDSNSRPLHFEIQLEVLPKAGTSGDNVVQLVNGELNVRGVHPPTATSPDWDHFSSKV